MTMLEIMNGVSRLLLGFVFLSAGGLKIVLGKSDLIEEWGEILTDRPTFNLRVLGMVEVTASFALLMPLLFGTPPQLAAIGAGIIILIMVGAMAFQARLKDWRSLTLNLALAGIGGFVLLTGPAS